MLRALPASQPAQPGVRRKEQVISEGPLVLTLRDVEVLIQNAQ